MNTTTPPVLLPPRPEKKEKPINKLMFLELMIGDFFTYDERK